jgi:hypothetical protein
MTLILPAQSINLPSARAVRTEKSLVVVVG